MTEYKKCIGECGLEKEINIENFQFIKSQNKFKNTCKVCVAKYNKQYRQEHRNTLLEQQKKWYNENKEEIKISFKEYYAENKISLLEYQKTYYNENKAEILKHQKEYQQENKEEIKKYNKEYYRENKQELNEYQKTYRQENKNEIREYHLEYHEKHKDKLRENNRIYQKSRRQNDPEYKLHKNISRSIYDVLKHEKGGKSVLEYLPYTMVELRKHIEKQFKNPGNEWMTWDNYGKYNKNTYDKNPTWNLDHIIPHSKFHYETMDCQEFRDCWALSNLRPLSSKQNLKDGNRR